VERGRRKRGSKGGLSGKKIPKNGIRVGDRRPLREEKVFPPQKKKKKKNQKKKKKNLTQKKKKKKKKRKKRKKDKPEKEKKKKKNQKKKKKRTPKKKKKKKRGDYPLAQTHLMAVNVRNHVRKKNKTLQTTERLILSKKKILIPSNNPPLFKERRK